MVVVVLALGANRFYLSWERFTLLHMMWRGGQVGPSATRELELRSLLSPLYVVSTTLAQARDTL